MVSKAAAKVESCGFISNSKRWSKRSSHWSPVPHSQSTGGLLFIVQFQAQAAVPWGTTELSVQTAGKERVGHFALSAALSCNSHSASFLWASAGAPHTTAPAISAAQCHTCTLPSQCQSVIEASSPVFEASCYISTSRKLPVCLKPSPQMQIALTLLTRISVASKCRPYILGDSPGIGSILTHTSWPFFATSTGLWFISILVTIPISTNCNTRKLL